MSLRVLVITPWFPNEPTDQAGNFILHSIEALRDAGVSVSVLVTRPWTPAAFGKLHPDWIRPPLRRELFDPTLEIDVKYYPSIPRGYWNELSGLLFRLTTRAALLRLASATGVQVMHAHTEMVGHAVLPVARKLGVPLVTTLHGINTNRRFLDTERKRARLRDALAGAARVVLVGEPLRPHFAAIAGRDDQFRVIPNGFAIGKSGEGAEVPLWGSTLRFISVSNLHEGKGVDLALQALAKLRQEGLESWTFAIVGGGAERSRLEAMTDAHGLRDKVVFHGPLSHDRAMEAIAQANVFVLPSYREAFGVAYLEAMAAGLLAIGVEGQGPATFISHGVTGLLVQPRSVQSVHDALKSAVENPQAMQQIAAAGRQLVRSEFTWARHTEKLIAVYLEALHG